MLIFLNRNVTSLKRYVDPKSDPVALTLSERFYIYHSNPLFIRKHAQLIMSANENACVCHQGYSVFSIFPFFFFAGHIPSSLGVILRTTDKIVWANEFECKLLENHSQNPYLAKVAFLFLIQDASCCSHVFCFLHSHRADLFNRVHLYKQPED